MALIKCPECGTEVSDKAAACVKCGAPIAKPTAEARPFPASPPPAAKKRSGCATVFLWIIGIFVALFIIGAVTGKKSDTAPTSAPAPAAASAPSTESSDKTCGKDDLQCRGDAGIIGASVYCRAPVERLAKHSVKWTDGTFEHKFSRFRWSDKNHDRVTYIGDKAEFQNGFGAYTPMIYTCDLDNDNKTVLGVNAFEGRLPN